MNKSKHVSLSNADPTSRLEEDDHGPVNEVESVPALDYSSDDEFHLISVTNPSSGPQTLSLGNEDSEEVETPGKSSGRECVRSSLPASPIHEELENPKIHYSDEFTKPVNSIRSVPNTLTKSQYENLRKWILLAADMEEKSGISLPETIRSNKNFKNPATYEKMINFCQIDPFGSHINSRPPFQKEDYFEAIDEMQHNQTKARSNPK